MTQKYTLPLSHPEATLENAGGKGASLARMIAAGLPIPDGFHITTAAYRQFVAENDLQPAIQTALQSADATLPASLEAVSNAIQELFLQGQIPQPISEAIALAYAALSGEHPVVAVRSSATAEDLPGLSFAGQQETYLNIHGLPALLDAVRRCWASLWTGQAIGYRMQHHIDQETVSLAVVVQALVFAEASGVLFTANPVTGQRDQTMLTATWGLGEAIVGGLVTPDTLTVEKDSGRVLTRETADKQVMTVRLETGTQEQPVPVEKRNAAVLEDRQVSELVRLGTQIEALYQAPMDIEWAFSNGQFAILQARPITALPEPAAPAPLKWETPIPGALYARGSIIEFLPDPLTPLFGTLGLDMIDAGTRKLLSTLTGDPKAWQNRMAVTINEYAYLTQMASNRQKWLMITHMIPMALDMLPKARKSWREEALPRYHGVVDRWQEKTIHQLSSAELLNGVCELMAAAEEYYTVLQSGVLGVTFTAEALFARVYDKMIRREGDPQAATLLLGYDSIPIQADKALYDIADRVKNLPELAAYLLRTPTAELAAQLAQNDLPVPDWAEWQSRMQAHLKKYGHMLYDFDFSDSVPADDPAPLLENIKMVLQGRGYNPYLRQQAAVELREQTFQKLSQRLKGLRKWIFLKLTPWAQNWSPLREDAIADMGLGYPLIRQMLRELGRRFVEARAIQQPDDIFWLVRAEVEDLVRLEEQGKKAPDLSAEIPVRKARWQAARQVVPPTMLPKGSRFEKLIPWREEGQAANTLKGFGASAGRVTATARVLQGPEDFSQMRPGDVLVANITTPAWTPLFALAAGIVTDIGGPLSHGSIVAREYGIPAVLGTGIATHRIRSGQVITVDGSSGTVYLESPGPSDVQQPPANANPWVMPNPKGQYMRASIVDLMPDPLSPLFQTLGIPGIVAGVHRIVKVLTHSDPILPADYFATINQYAYLGTRYSLREWLWILFHMMPAMPRMIREGIPFWRDQIRPQYIEAVARWKNRPLEQMQPGEILRGIHEVVDAAGDYLGSMMVGTMGVSAGSEGMFTRVYEKLVQKTGDPSASAFLMGYDSVPIRAEKSLFDLAEQARRLPALEKYLLDTPEAEIIRALASDIPPEGLDAEAWINFCKAWQAHQEAYGHILYNLDFARPLPLDHPDPLLETCKMYLRGEGRNPHERQQTLENQRIQSTQIMQSRVKGLRRWAFDRSLRFAQSLSAVRESAIADIGLGYPQIRKMCLELGRRLARAGAVETPEDIFWLELAEIETAVSDLENGAVPALRIESVRQRKAAHRLARQQTPPPMLPPGKKYMGFDVSSFVPGDESEQSGNTLKGVAASAGCVTGKARVLHSPEEFSQMRPGEVLVAAITTPAWTPLFAMASAIITDVGGPLSHGSIVAREYGIPAVLGTGIATRRIRSGMLVTVDGSAGLVTLVK